MNNIFNKSTYVKYASSGICRIEDIISMDFSGTHEPKEYYVLCPLADNTSTVYVPADNEVLAAKMTRVLTKSEVDSLISDSVKIGIEWTDDRKLRKERFDEILSRCNQVEYLRLISCLYIKQHALSKEGKNLTFADESVLKQAEKAIENEFSFILGIPPTEVGGYIRRKLDSAI